MVLRQWRTGHRKRNNPTRKRRGKNNSANYINYILWLTEFFFFSKIFIPTHLFLSARIFAYMRLIKLKTTRGSSRDATFDYYDVSSLSTIILFSCAFLAGFSEPPACSSAKLDCRLTAAWPPSATTTLSTIIEPQRASSLLLLSPEELLVTSLEWHVLMQPKWGFSNSSVKKWKVESWMSIRSQNQTCDLSLTLWCVPIAPRRLWIRIIPL